MLPAVNNHNPAGELTGDDEFWDYISWNERIILKDRQRAVERNKEGGETPPLRRVKHPSLVLEGAVLGLGYKALLIA